MKASSVLALLALAGCGGAPFEAAVTGPETDGGGLVQGEDAAPPEGATPGVDAVAVVEGGAGAADAPLGIILHDAAPDADPVEAGDAGGVDAAHEASVCMAPSSHVATYQCPACGMPGITCAPQTSATVPASYVGYNAVNLVCGLIDTPAACACDYSCNCITRTAQPCLTMAPFGAINPGHVTSCSESSSGPVIVTCR